MEEYMESPLHSYSRIPHYPSLYVARISFFIRLSDLVMFICIFCTVSFQLWHLQLITGLVILISSCRFLLLKTWPDFAESSEAANQQVAPLKLGFENSIKLQYLLFFQQYKTSYKTSKCITIFSHFILQNSTFNLFSVYYIRFL